MKGCARRVREGPRQGPAETRAETKRSNAGQPAGAAPAPAARSWQRPLPRARSAPNFSFTLSPPPSKKAGFWQRRGRRSGSAGSSWRPSRRGSRLPFASSRTSRGHPLAPTRARPRSRSQSQEAPACRKGTGDTPKPGRETGAGTSRSWKGWGHATISYGHVPQAKPESRGGGVAACVAAVRLSPSAHCQVLCRRSQRSRLPQPKSQNQTTTAFTHLVLQTCVVRRGSGQVLRRGGTD